MRTKVVIFLSVLLAIASLSSAAYVGMTDSEFTPHYRRQENTNWCWAACAEMALSSSGVNIPQTTLVQVANNGNISNAPGFPPQMIMLTNNLFTQPAGHAAVVSGQMVQGAIIPTVLYNHLKRKKPVIIEYNYGGGTGHAIVLIGMDYEIVNHMILIKTMYIFDPFSYAQVPNPWGGYSLQPDNTKIRKSYGFYPTPGNTPTLPTFPQIVPFPGVIQNMIMIEGTTL